MYRNLILFFSLIISINSAQTKGKNLILITMDGLRWQEIFYGADSVLIQDSKFVEDLNILQNRFWANSVAERREKLMPFFWKTISKNGQLYGNHDKGSRVLLVNKEWSSYPGYNEILTGFADPEIISNDKIWNKNITFLEFLNGQRHYSGKVAAFCSWEVFPYIVNSQRSNIPISAGRGGAMGSRLTDREKLLNKLIQDMPTPFKKVRWDSFTFQLSMEYLEKKRPKVLYIAFDATDDYAHEGKYDRYLMAAYRQDQFLNELWQWLQSHPFYRKKTSIIITTDHGRGELDKWTSHGRNVSGGDKVWLAVMGPDTPASGEMDDHSPIFSNQIAATASALLNVYYVSRKPIGGIIETMVKK